MHAWWMSIKAQTRVSSESPQSKQACLTSEVPLARMESLVRFHRQKQKWKQTNYCVCFSAKRTQWLSVQWDFTGQSSYICLVRLHWPVWAPFRTLYLCVVHHAGQEGGRTWWKTSFAVGHQKTELHGSEITFSRKKSFSQGRRNPINQDEGGWIKN